METGTKIEGAVVGTVIGISPGGAPLVDYPGNPEGPIPGRSTVKVGPGSIGREAVLMFDSGDPARPLILGILAAPGLAASVEIETDGRSLRLSAEREIVLRCGRASITLTREGKVLLQGAYVSSRSSGANRIKGGTVHIN